MCELGIVQCGYNGLCLSNGVSWGRSPTEAPPKVINDGVRVFVKSVYVVLASAIRLYLVIIVRLSFRVEGWWYYVSILWVWILVVAL